MVEAFSIKKEARNKISMFLLLPPNNITQNVGSFYE